MVELRENEQKTLLAVQTLGNVATVSQIMKVSDLAHAAVMRATLKLSKEKLIKIEEQKQTVASLNDEGRIYAETGLPERHLLNSLIRLGGEAKIDKTVKSSKLKASLVPIALGWLVRKKWATINQEKNTLKTSKEPRKGEDEHVLSVLAKQDTVVIDELSKGKRAIIAALRKRKLLQTEEKTVRTLTLTGKGQKHVGKKAKTKEVSQLTPELIIRGKWRTTKLRRFDVAAPGPQICPGKTHPLQQIIERARQIFLEMGFTEIRGPLVETAFWNFDALFQPQHHPAREMQDTFYLSFPKTGRLPEEKVLNAVAETHENGGTTGSKGWGYQWSRREARRLVLRTHTTAETIKHLSLHKKPPVKVFSVDRVYRNEQLTFRNLAEFYQIEGVVVDRKVTLRDLMGTLKAFYTRFGLKNVQFWPSYFPYTEPSAQAVAYAEKLECWMELCGMGMFRPEVLIPLGIENPVLAWGGGLERIAMLELELDDIRQLYGNSLEWIRRTPIRQ